MHIQNTSTTINIRICNKINVATNNFSKNFFATNSNAYCSVVIIKRSNDNKI